MKYLIILLLTINLSFSQDIIYLKKGDVAPNKGYLVKDNQMKKFRKINEENKILKKKEIKLKDLNEIQEERVELYKDDSEHYQKALRKEKVKGNLKTIGGFLVGVFATSLAAWAAIQATK